MSPILTILIVVFSAVLVTSINASNNSTNTSTTSVRSSLVPYVIKDDSTGTAANAKLQVFQSTFTYGSPQARKRGSCLSALTAGDVNSPTVASSGDEIPTDAVFLLSYCADWEGDSRKWAADYTLPNGLIHTVFGECAPDELCFEGPRPDGEGLERSAFCVRASDFVAVSLPGQQITTDIASTCAEQQGSTASSADVARAVLMRLTGDDPDISLNASHLQIDAQSALELFDAVSYKTLPGGAMACESCSQLGMWPVPDTADRLEVSYQLPEGSNGKLYWAYLLMPLGSASSNGRRGMRSSHAPLYGNPSSI